MRLAAIHISIAGVNIGLECQGQGCLGFYRRLKTALRGYIVSGSCQQSFIKISYRKERESRPALYFSRRGKRLTISVSGKVASDRMLWSVFLEKLKKYFYDFVLSSRDVILIHSSACAIKNKGYLFLGSGGAGKSTVIGLLKGADIISDDKTFIRRKGKGYYLFPVPFLNRKVIKKPIYLDKIFLLKKSKRVRLEKVSKAAAMAAILARVKDLNYLFKQDINKVFDFSYGIALSAAAYKMYFKKDKSFWKQIQRNRL